MTLAEKVHEAWLKRPKDTFEREPHSFGCRCQGCHCPTCNREYYWSANSGCYECRSNDCPPGKEAEYQANLAAGKRLLDELRLVEPRLFASVDDLAHVVALCNQSVPLPSGRALEEIKRRIREGQ